MNGVRNRRTSRLVLRLAIVVAAIAQPFMISFDEHGLTIVREVALADDDGGGGGSGSGGGSHDGHSGHDGGGQSDDGDHSAEDASHRKSGSSTVQHRFRVGLHGEKIEIDATGISIVYSDGFREDIRNGVLELTDPDGRTVIRRAATSKDFKRIHSL